jgi:hypothetical protein
LSYTGKGREVEDGLNAAQSLPHVIRIAYVSPDAFDGRMHIVGETPTHAMNLRIEQIDYSNGMPMRGKQKREVGADKTCATGYENMGHGTSFDKEDTSRGKSSP